MVYILYELMSNSSLALTDWWYGGGCLFILNNGCLSKTSLKGRGEIQQSICITTSTRNIDREGGREGGREGHVHECMHMLHANTLHLC